MKALHGHASNWNGKRVSGTYLSWSGMISRCYRASDPYYHRYGGRGIKTSKRWKKFVYFLEDMGERPYGTTLDRKNNDGNYSKRNCRWATPKEQARSFSKLTDDQRKQIVMRYNQGGVSQAQLAKEYGVTQSRVCVIVRKV